MPRPDAETPNLAARQFRGLSLLMENDLRLLLGKRRWQFDGQRAQLERVAQPLAPDAFGSIRELQRAGDAVESSVTVAAPELSMLLSATAGGDPST
ncbi:hypothetical protein ACVWZV_005153 [Bradyrhizobium sp. GM5.1]|jgi:hypothetical protein